MKVIERFDEESKEAEELFSSSGNEYYQGYIDGLDKAKAIYEEEKERNTKGLC